MSDERKRKPERIAAALESFLAESGLGERIEQARVVPEWDSLVGAQIAAVTAPRAISADGTLWVWVTTNAWMTELALLEPELLRSLNADPKRKPVKRIRWQLRRP